MKNILKLHPLKSTNFVRAQGCRLYDQAGKEYLDFESGIWTLALGHCHPSISETIKTQVDLISHLGVPFVNEATVQAADDVLNLLNMRNGKCAFLSSGSEAVYLAIAIARKLRPGKRFLVFSSSYLAAYESIATKPESEWIVIDWRNLILEPQMESFLNGDQFNWEEVGGFVFESGGSGSESVEFPSFDLIQKLVSKIKTHDGLIVSDEVTTGFGRLGKMFGFEHYDLCPDLVALGKCIGNGYPVSAVAACSEIAQAVDDLGHRHAQSHQNDPLGCKIVSAVIRQFEQTQLVERSVKTGNYFLKKLKSLEAHDCVKEVRGRGMLLALEFIPQIHFRVEDIHEALFESGFIVGCAADRNFLRFDPPLIIVEQDIDRLVNKLNEILRNL